MYLLGFNKHAIYFVQQTSSYLLYQVYFHIHQFPETRFATIDERPPFIGITRALYGSINIYFNLLKVFNLFLEGSVRCRAVPICKINALPQIDKENLSILVAQKFL